MKKYKNHLIIFGVILTAFVLVIVLAMAPSKPGQYDEFAVCLEDSGAVFYGAFWCPACQEQKGLFGRSANNLPYVECSTPDGRGQLQICNQAGIESYPTWEFSNGERLKGVISLEDLSEKTDCSLPSNTQA